MKREPVKQHPDLFEESKAPIQVSFDLKKEMLQIVEMMLIEITTAVAIESKEIGDDQDHA
jgi:hypothetical protein